MRIELIRFSCELFISVLTGCILLSLSASSFASGAKKIVIVPDKGTFLYYLSLWSPEERFPIFIGDSVYVRKFASVYNGGNVEIEHAEKRKDCDVSQKNIYRALLASLSAKDYKATSGNSKSDLKDYFRDQNIIPKGIVLTNLESAEWPAGLALASYHKQILAFYDPPPPPILNDYTRSAKEDIRKDIIGILEKWGVPYKNQGVGIDAITIALDIPFKYDGYFSLDDAINREDENATTCYACTGRLMDLGKGLALYQAMCSIFLPVSSGLFFDKWPVEWLRSLEIGCWELRKHVPCISIRDDMKKWHEAVRELNRFSIVFVSAAGNPDRWSGAKVDDIPDSVPVAVHFAHSSSAANPADRNTIAGRWLANGAFVYYGAVSEPYAASFNVSQVIIKKWLEGAPFAQAVSQKETLPAEYAKPWKLIYIGDPLFYARFEVPDTLKDFYTVMKDSITALEGLEFGKAEGIFEAYLNRKVELPDNPLTYEQATQYLKKLYELIFLELVFGTNIYKYYNINFVLSWFADYPHTREIRKQLYMDDDAVIALFEKKFESVKNFILPQSYLDVLWTRLLNEVRSRRIFVPYWNVLGPISQRDVKSPEDDIKSILLADGKVSLWYGDKEIRWQEKNKNPLSNRVEVNNTDLDSSVCYALTHVKAQKTLNARINFFATCAAKIYLDKKLLTEYDTSQLSTPVAYPVNLEQGEHQVLVVFYPTKQDAGKFALGFSDEKKYTAIAQLIYLK